jgi:dTDP-glucose 4,6-dehydratase
MYTILVTGGAGFVGSNFVRWILERGGTRVINLDLLTYAGSLEGLSPWRDSPQHIFIQGDIADRALVSSLLRRYECQAIVNFAAETHVDRSIGDPGSFVRTNVLGTFELLEAALAYWESLAGELQQQFRLLHVSTDEVYGSLSTDGFFTENSPYAPNSPYAASKASSDHFVRAYQHTYGLPVLITNCSNNYGPYQFPEKLIPLTILNVLHGRPVSVYGNGQNVRDWLHVDDHCRALQLVLQHGHSGEVYNVGGNCERTNLEVVTAICETIDAMRPELPYGPSTRLLRFVADRPGHDFRYAVDSSKLHRQLGWRPTIGFREGLERTVRWYRDNLSFVESVSSVSYRGERLGLERLRHSQFAAEPIEVARKASVALESSVAVAHDEPTAITAARGEPTAASDVLRSPRARSHPWHQDIEGVEFIQLRRQSTDQGAIAELYHERQTRPSDWPIVNYLIEAPPKATHGPHASSSEADYLAFVGPGDFQLSLWDSRISSSTHGNRIECVVGMSDPQAVVIPPGVVHSYKNIGEQAGCVLNAVKRSQSRSYFEPIPDVHSLNDTEPAAIR